MKKLVVGLTGGIGSGKTAASDHFAELGIDVVDADLVSREIVEPGRPALLSIAEHFGPQFVRVDGNLDRAALRTRVFGDDAALSWLNELTHPLIGIEITARLQAARSDYVILVSPLLLETGQRHLCHRILVIDVPVEVQTQRAAERDATEPEQIKRIIANQADRASRLAQADDVLTNSGTIQALKEGVERLHKQYLGLAMEFNRDN